MCLSCLEKRDLEAAKWVHSKVSAILSSSHAPAHNSQSAKTASTKQFELDILVSGVAGVQHAATWRTAAGGNSDQERGGAQTSELPSVTSTDLEQWVDDMASKLSEALEVSSVGLTVHSTSATLPALPHSRASTPSPSPSFTPSLRSQSSLSAASASRALPAASSEGGAVGGLGVMLRLTLDAAGMKAWTMASAGGLGALKKWRKDYNVVVTEQPCAAFRLWLLRPLPRFSSDRVPLCGRASGTLDLSGSSAPEMLAQGEQEGALLARALHADMRGVEVIGCKVSKSRRVVSLCISASLKHQVSLYFEQLLADIRTGRLDKRREPGAPAKSEQAANAPKRPMWSGEEDVKWDSDGEEGDAKGGARAQRGGEPGGVLDEDALDALRLLQDLLYGVEKRDSRIDQWHALYAFNADTSKAESSNADSLLTRSSSAEEAEKKAYEDVTAEMHLDIREWWLTRHMQELAVQQEIFAFLDSSYCPVASRDALIKQVLGEVRDVRLASRVQPKLVLLQAPPGSGKSSLTARLVHILESRATDDETLERGRDFVVYGTKRPGMAVMPRDDDAAHHRGLSLCEYLAGELALQLRGSQVLPQYLQKHDDAPEAKEEEEGAQKHDGEEAKLPDVGSVSNEGAEGEVTVYHGGGSVLTMTPCAEGVQIWADRQDYTLRVLPRIFDGSSLVYAQACLFLVVADDACFRVSNRCGHAH
jgi:hypothetical protein